MCQIFAGPANKIRATLLDTKDLLEDLYTSNPHGLGAMYATSKRKLRMPKIVPANVLDAQRFIRQLPDDDRNLVIHFRWKTSGKVDNDNAHPFVVLPELMGMTHNGVLSISTKSDETKCDSRHYIERVIRPQLTRLPELAQVEEWLELVASDIGSSNRFVFMDNEGRMSFVNRDTGIEHDGMWIANTYSFDAALLIPGYVAPKYKGVRGSGWDDYDYTGFYTGGSVYGSQADLEGAEADIHEVEAVAEAWSEDVWCAIAESDPQMLEDLLLDKPYLTLRTLFKDCEFNCSVDAATELSKGDYEYVKMLEDEQVTEMATRILRSDHHASKLAEVACWYGEWMGKAIDQKGDSDAPSVAAIELAASAAEAANEAYAG